jgi:hypothetical protein
MRITIEISDELLREAHAVAAQTCETLAALVERGLQQLIRNQQSPGAFKLRTASLPATNCSQNFALLRGTPCATKVIEAAAVDGRGDLLTQSAESITLRQR